MKHHLKTCILLFVTSILLTTCQKDSIQTEDTILEEQGDNDVFKIGRLEDFKALSQFVSKDIINYQNLNYQFRTATEDANGFIILNDEITQAINDNGSTFTLKIVKDNQEANSFSNLVVNFKEGHSTETFIINYYPTENYLTSLETNPQTVFKGQFNMESIDYDGSLDYLYARIGGCSVVTNTYCNWGGQEHDAGENCTAAFMYTRTQLVCSTKEEYESYSVVLPDNPFGGGGGGTSSSTTTPKFVTPCEIESNISVISGSSVNVTENGCTDTISSLTKQDLLVLRLQLNAVEDSDLINWINDRNNEDAVDEAIAFLEENQFSEAAKKEAKLTLSTLASDVSWVANTGNYNNISSLAYTHTRTIIVNGTLLGQFKLANGDWLSGGNYNLCTGCTEGEDRLYYFSQDANLWYEIPNPSNYTPLNLDFLWTGFWDAVEVGARYCTPLEDFVILIDGKDFDGVESSRAVAGGFILLEIVPGTGLIKLVKVVKYGDEIVDVANGIRKYVDDIYRSQKQLLQDVLDGTELLTNNTRRGNFGEIFIEVDLYEKGYEFINRVDGVVDLNDTSIHTNGIDHIIKNDADEYFLIETKYNTATLGSTVNYGQQMSEEWITHHLDELGEIGEEISDAGYISVLAHVAPDGTITYKILNAAGQWTGDFWTP
ncbi:hypothetical protein [Ichthyenterobacterium magnum]|uniref:Uncharacterized protein n=1 Tax=Ichthyenterobacterium magnum TaxID=1230530 RepID=A0A420DXV1_9FLAO|nr:hypothetical protein [Ichthyenterobacterium magnum]RKE99039.1 hypothetical protein BXY80_1140 [Ichthyenterobacterium magnum]